MATREVLQEGRTVRVDAKGNKTYAPMRETPDERPTPRALGSGGAANAAQSILDARNRREAEAGMKRGGAVKKAPAKKTTATKVKPKGHK